MVYKDVGISVTNLIKNMKLHISDINRLEYMTDAVRYPLDIDFAMTLYHEDNGDLKSIAKHLGLKSCYNVYTKHFKTLNKQNGS